MKNFLSFSVFVNFLLFSSISISQVPIINFNEDECYIIARGTKSKQSFISKQFNIINDSITHIGIGIKLKDSFKIFNVNAIRNTNAISIEDYKSFINQPDLKYLGIWEVDINEKKKNILKKFLFEVAQKHIDFDFDFLIGNGNKNLYCSEFCWLATNELGPDFIYRAKKIATINSGLDKILKREILEYIPPDYFLTFSKIKFLASWWNND